MTDQLERPLGDLLMSPLGWLLAAAFHDDPVTCWLVPDPRLRPLAMGSLFTTVTLDAAAEQGLRIQRAGSGDGPVVAVATWFDRTEPADALEFPATEADDSLFERWRILQVTLAAAHPVEPHHHLAFLGVHPDHHGTGHGSRLLHEHHEHLDATGTPAYLEASSPHNRRLYLRHGYHDHGEPLQLPDGPHLYPMWRDPAASRAEPPGMATAGAGPDRSTGPA